MRVSHPEPIEIEGPAGVLEALVEKPSSPAAAVAVVCHPHPLYSGTMHNKVAHTLARSFRALGAIAVRFNFRGVGASAGEYAEGVGELDDALAVADWARNAWPSAVLYFAGFSFGSGVALRAAVRRPVRGLVTVALPVLEFAQDVELPSSPWLAVHGDLDELVALADAERWFELSAPGTKLVVIDGATHFFHGKLEVLAREVQGFFAADFAARSEAAPRRG
ncbi:MAG TPA: CocE/NonD family hydrolase [Gammaproteobacteria bacterium]|nr:CocE/NonD family hydrolase [Gammaproteobacteria bacterium]